MQAIYDEDLAERKARHEKETTIRGYIDHFIKEQEAYKKIKQDEMEAENDKIRQYAEQVGRLQAHLTLLVIPIFAVNSHWPPAILGHGSRTSATHRETKRTERQG